MPTANGRKQRLTIPVTGSEKANAAKLTKVLGSGSVAKMVRDVLRHSFEKYVKGKQSGDLLASLGGPRKLVDRKHLAAVEAGGVLRPGDRTNKRADRRVAHGGANAALPLPRLRGKTGNRTGPRAKARRSTDAVA